MVATYLNMNSLVNVECSSQDGGKMSRLKALIVEENVLIIQMFLRGRAAAQSTDCLAV